MQFEGRGNISEPRQRSGGLRARGGGMFWDLRPARTPTNAQKNHESPANKFSENQKPP